MKEITKTLTVRLYDAGEPIPEGKDGEVLILHQKLYLDWSNYLECWKEPAYSGLTLYPESDPNPFGGFVIVKFADLFQPQSKEIVWKPRELSPFPAIVARVGGEWIGSVTTFGAHEYDAQIGDPYLVETFTSLESAKEAVEEHYRNSNPA